MTDRANMPDFRHRTDDRRVEVQTDRYAVAVSLARLAVYLVLLIGCAWFVLFGDEGYGLAQWRVVWEEETAAAVFWGALVPLIVVISIFLMQRRAVFDLREGYSINGATFSPLEEIVEVCFYESPLGVSYGLLILDGKNRQLVWQSRRAGRETWRRLHDDLGLPVRKINLLLLSLFRLRLNHAASPLVAFNAVALIIVGTGMMASDLSADVPRSTGPLDIASLLLTPDGVILAVGLIHAIELTRRYLASLRRTRLA